MSLLQKQKSWRESFSTMLRLNSSRNLNLGMDSSNHSGSSCSRGARAASPSIRRKNTSSSSSRDLVAQSASCRLLLVPPVYKRPGIIRPSKYGNQTDDRNANTNRRVQFGPDVVFNEKHKVVCAKDAQNAAKARWQASSSGSDDSRSSTLVGSRSSGKKKSVPERSNITDSASATAAPSSTPVPPRMPSRQSSTRTMRMPSRQQSARNLQGAGAAVAAVPVAAIRLFLDATTSSNPASSETSKGNDNYNDKTNCDKDRRATGVERSHSNDSTSSSLSSYEPPPPRPQPPRMPSRQSSVRTLPARHVDPAITASTTTMMTTISRVHSQRSSVRSITGGMDSYAMAPLSGSRFKHC